MEADVIVGFVVEAHRIQNCAEAVVHGRAITAGGGDRPRGIFGMDDGGEFLANGRVGPLALFGDFIADAPGENAGVVAIPADKRALILFVPQVEEVGAAVVIGALGAAPRVIISQIITESVVLTTFSGYFGLTLGVGLLELINYLLEKSKANTEMFLHPGINFNVAITALAILVVAGALAGLIPARKAVSVKPIDALRYE